MGVVKNVKKDLLFTLLIVYISPTDKLTKTDVQVER